MYQRGLSLVELMVSLTIGLIILAGMTTLFVNQNEAHKNLEKTARVIENGRVAMQILADELQVAGYYGHLNPNGLSLPGGVPDPCVLADTLSDDALRLHVQGIDNVTAVPTCVQPDTIKSNTDLIVIRRASTETMNVSELTGAAGNFLQVSQCKLENVFVLDTEPGNMNLLARDCASPAQVRPFLIRIYYVNADNILKRVELDDTGGFGAPVALVEGIESLQFEYGEDDDGDGVADFFSNCSGCTETNFANTVAVRVHLLSRSLASFPNHEDTNDYQLGDASFEPPAGDPYKRRVYSQFVRLVNPAGRME